MVSSCSWPSRDDQSSPTSSGNSESWPCGNSSTASRRSKAVLIAAVLEVISRTPAALARALEHERGISITFVPHVSEEPGVSGMVYRHEGRENTYSIVFRPTHNLVLRRLILFHELAHLLFNHLVTDVGGEGALRGYMVTDAEDAVAEAFAVGAMQYSFGAEDPLPLTDRDDDVSPSAFGQYLKRTAHWP